jgi:hypothetical protein
MIEQILESAGRAIRRVIEIVAEDLEAEGQTKGNIDILIQHSGRSTLEIDGRSYTFEHLGYDGKPVLVWKSIWDAESRKIRPGKISSAAESLLLIILNAQTDKLFLFQRPGLNAPVSISKLPSKGGNLTKLKIDVKYSYSPN